METIAIVVGVITGLAGITGASYKLYRDIQNRQEPHEVVIRQPENICPGKQTPPSPLLDKIVKKTIKRHMDQRDSDGSDTEIDINIRIQTHNNEEKDIKTKKRRSK